MRPQNTQVQRTETQTTSLTRKLGGKLTTLEVSSPASVTALSVEVLDVLRAAPVRSGATTQATSGAVPRAPARAAPTSLGRALRVSQEIDRLALARLSAYYGRDFALPSALEERGPVSFLRQGRRIQRAYDQLVQHVVEAEAHPYARSMKVTLRAQGFANGNDARLSVFAAIDHRRTLGVRIPMLGHVRREAIVGPSGFVPVLDVTWRDGELVDLMPEVPGDYATRGSRYFTRSPGGPFADPARPENVDAEGRKWSVGLLFFSGHWSEVRRSRRTSAEDRAPQPASGGTAAFAPDALPAGIPQEVWSAMFASLSAPGVRDQPPTYPGATAALSAG